MTNFLRKEISLRKIPLCFAYTWEKLYEITETDHLSSPAAGMLTVHRWKNLETVMVTLV